MLFVQHVGMCAFVCIWSFILYACVICGLRSNLLNQLVRCVCFIFLNSQGENISKTILQIHWTASWCTGNKTSFT